MKPTNGLPPTGATELRQDPARAERGAGHQPIIRRPVDDLKRIEAALRRLDDGKFGHCLYCGDQISVKRLDVDPTAESCAVCNED